MNALNNLRTGTKLVGGFLGVAVLIALVGTIGSRTSSVAAAAAGRMYRDHLQPTQGLGLIDAAQANIRGDVYRFIVEPADRAALENAIAGERQRVQTELGKLQAAALDAEERAEAARFAGAWRDYEQAVGDVLRLVAANRTAEALPSLGAGGATIAARQRMSAALSNLSQSMVRRAEEEKRLAEESAASAKRFLLAITLAGMLLAVGLGLMIARSITGPLRKAVGVLEEMAKGHLHARLSMGRKDEIGQLAETLDRFADDLQGRVVSAMQRVAAGDLAADVEVKDGEDEIGGALERTTLAVRGLVAEVNTLSHAAVEGRLAARANASAFQGSYREVIEGVNGTLDAVVGPLNVAAEYVDRISKGDIPPKIVDAYRGDFNEIKNNLNLCIDAVGGLVTDAERLAEAAMDGKLAARADATKHQGHFRRVIEEVNGTLDAVVQPLNVAAEYVDRISKGDIPPKIADTYRGDFNEIKNNLNLCIEAVGALVTDAERLAGAAIEGKLAVRADATRHQGHFRQIIAKVNETLDAVVGPLNVAAEYVERIGKGEIPPKVTEAYRGDFNEIKNSLNACIDGLTGLVEVDQVLQQMKANDYTRQVSGAYQGAFAEVAEAVNEVRERLLHVQGTAVKIGNGDLSDLDAYREIGNGTGRRSEHDQLVPSFISMMEGVKNLVEDAEALSASAVQGRLADRADAKRHRGEFRRVIEGVNATLDAVIGPLNVAAEYMDRISKGDIPPRITEAYNGDFNEIKTNLNVCIDAIAGLVADTHRLADAAVAGDLRGRADATRHQGDFRRVVEGLNRTLDAIALPVAEAAAVLAKVAQQDLRVAVRGDYVGDHAAMKTSINTMVDDLRQSMGSIAQNARSVGDSSEALDTISQQMATNAEETAAQTGVVSAASEQVSRNLTVVATSSEEMLASIREISKSANEAAHMAKNAVSFAQGTNETVRKLGESSNEIGNVIKVITSIAEQTNLLALNATIEAARAGDAGKGFAVVANEVKELAKQTAQATEEISQKILGIQSETSGAVDAIAQIVNTISQIDSVSNTIASAVEEQTATTNEIGRNITEAARGAEEIARNVSSVAEAARSTSLGAAETQKAARGLKDMAAELRTHVGRFSV